MLFTYQVMVELRVHHAQYGYQHPHADHMESSPLIGWCSQ